MCQKTNKKPTKVLCYSHESSTPLSCPFLCMYFLSQFHILQSQNDIANTKNALPNGLLRFFQE